MAVAASCLQQDVPPSFNPLPGKSAWQVRSSTLCTHLRAMLACARPLA